VDIKKSQESRDAKGSTGFLGETSRHRFMVPPAARTEQEPSPVLLHEEPDKVGMNPSK